MHTRNNFIVICSLACAVFLCCIPLGWFTVLSAGIEARGTNGTIGVLGVSLPIWLPLLISAAATLIAALNVLDITSIPKAVVLLMLLLPAAFYLTVFFLPRAQLEIEGGPFVATADTLGMLIVVFLTPRPKAQEA